MHSPGPRKFLLLPVLAFHVCTPAAQLRFCAKSTHDTRRRHLLFQSQISVFDHLRTKHRIHPSAAVKQRSGPKSVLELPDLKVALDDPALDPAGEAASAAARFSNAEHKDEERRKRPRDVTRMEKMLLGKMKRASKDYAMIEPNDKIMVAVSGGKDSATLLHLMRELTKIVPFSFEVVAVHLEQGQPGFPVHILEDWLVAEGYNHRIIYEDTYSIVKEKTKPGSTYCSLCSRLRRGILYTAAHDMGCTKLALGHHLDDALETLALNMIHQGQMKAMPASYYSDARQMQVIRPLIYAQEEDIRQYAAAKQFPILPCNLCGSQPNAHRAKVKLLLSTFESLNPQAKKNMLRALQDVRPSHLLDQNLREACGFDPKTGVVVDDRAHKLNG